MSLIGYDLDGVITEMGTLNVPDGQQAVVISGRTFSEYDLVCRSIAQHIPIYIRGVGAYGDHEHAGRFKAAMIQLLGVTEFHEDEPRQVEIISELCPDVTIVRYGRAALQ